MLVLMGILITIAIGLMLHIGLGVAWLLSFAVGMTWGIAICIIVNLVKSGYKSLVSSGGSLTSFIVMVIIGPSLLAIPYFNGVDLETLLALKFLVIGTGFAGLTLGWFQAIQHNSDKKTVE